MAHDPADAIVVGGGPAGLSAALWLGRYRRDTVVVDAGRPRNLVVEHTSGYLGFDGEPAAAIHARGVAEVARYPSVRTCAGDAASAAVVDGVFEVVTDQGTLVGRTVVLCTGVVDLPPPVEGAFEHYGADLFTCPACDGYESRDRDVVVFGWSDELSGLARGLRRWARSVTILSQGHPVDGVPDDIPVVETPPVALVGPRGDLRGVRLADGGFVPCTTAFFHIAQQPKNRLALELGCQLGEAGCVIVDAEGRTSVDGVFAAGDVTPGPQLTARAVASGAIAGIACALSV